MLRWPRTCAPPPQGAWGVRPAPWGAKLAACVRALLRYTWYICSRSPTSVRIRCIDLPVAAEPGLQNQAGDGLLFRFAPGMLHAVAPCAALYLQALRYEQL